MPPMFVRVVARAVGPDDEAEEEDEREDADGREARPPCPFVVACQSDVLTLCRGAVASQVDGAVARCLVDNFPLLSEECSDFVQERVAADEADADADDMADAALVDNLDDATMRDGDPLDDEGPVEADVLDDGDGAADDLDGMASGLLSCERDASALCVEAMMVAETDPLAIQRCLVDRRDVLSPECRLLVDYMLGAADEGAADAEREAGDAPVPADDAEAAAEAAAAADAAASSSSSSSSSTPPAGVSPGQAAAERRCNQDADRVCGSATGRLEKLACLHRHAEDISEECVDVLDALPAYHCAEDATRLCHQSRSRIGLIKCLRAHAEEVGDECLASLKQHRELRQQDGAPAAPKAQAGAVAGLRERVARAAGRRMDEARSNPAPAVAGLAAVSALAAALIVYARRRTADRRRQQRKDRDAGASAGADGALASPGSALSDGATRARPGVLMAFRPAVAEQL